MKKLLILATAVLPACATAPSENGTATPPGLSLSYAVPTPSAVTYAFNDSSSFNVQGGAIGDVHATINAAGTAAVTFATKGTDVEATIDVTDFAGSMTNSAMGGGPKATEADIDGNAVITVAPNGTATVVSMPKLNNAVMQVGVSGSFFRRFFVRLPAHSVRPGAAWTDTITFTEDNAGTKVEVTDIQTSTFVKDTTVDGRTLAYITTSAQRSLNVAGTTQGVQIAQKLGGVVNGTVLWDAQRNLLVERKERSELSGTFDLPQMGITGLPVTAASSGSIALK